jgi:hypothetical protein
MHIIVGLILALTLLYFWLLGHWFARVVTFLGLTVICGFAGYLAGAQMADHARNHVVIPGKFIPATHNPADVMSYFDLQEPPRVIVDEPPSPVPSIVGVALGAGFAWWISGIPVYWNRKQARRQAMAQRLEH